MKKLYRVHKWTALTLFALLAVQLGSGVCLAVIQLGVAAAGPHNIPNNPRFLEQLMETAGASAPGLRVDRLSFPEGEPALAEVRLWLPDGGLARFLLVRLDTGQVESFGSILVYPERLFLYLHSNLLAGGAAQWLVVATGLGAMTLLLTGLAQWWPRGRKLRDAMTVHTSWPPKLVLFDVHRVIGAYGAFPCLVTVGAGLLLALQPHVAPQVPADACITGVADRAAALTLEEAWQLARQRQPARRLSQLRFCGENQRVAGFLFTDGGPSDSMFLHQVWIDRLSDAGPREIGEATPGLASGLDRVLLPLHTGRLLNWPGEIAVLVLGTALLLSLLTGGCLWVVRARERRERAARRRRAGTARADV
jgi:uncharacterized iron-regulated membrane protein